MELKTWLGKQFHGRLLYVNCRKVVALANGNILADYFISSAFGIQLAKYVKKSGIKLQTFFRR